MSSQLERKKLIAQHARVAAVRMELEVKLEELAEASARVQRDVDIQIKAENDLKIKLDQMED